MEKSVPILIGDVAEIPHELELNLDRGIHDMANTTFNVVDFGAIPDNSLPTIVTANTEAYRRAGQEAVRSGGGTVFTPPGVFYVQPDGSGPWCIDVPGDHMTYAGAGQQQSIIRMAPGQPPSSTLLFRANGRANVHWADLTLDGNWGAVVGSTTTQAGIHHETLKDPQSHGLMLRGADHVRIRRVTFTQIYGDAIWMGANANDDLTDITTDVLIDDCTMHICARNGISFGAPAHGVSIERCRMSAIFTTCIDAEPQGLFDGVRDVVVSRCKLDGWWNGQGNNQLISVVGGYPSAYNQSAAARGWRIVNNDIHGSINVFSAVDIVIRENRLTTDFSSPRLAIAPIFVDHMVDDITIVDNYIYDNTPKSKPTGDAHNGAITIQAYGNQQPAGIRVKGNRIHARQGTHGIWINSQGGFSKDDRTPIVDPYIGGKATGVDAQSLTDSTAPWTENQWVGWRVIMGGVVACVVPKPEPKPGEKPVENTVLTLEPSFKGREPNAWFTPTGERAKTPSLGSYIITSNSGCLDIEANDIDCGFDGNAAGGHGISVFNDRAGGIIRIRDNNIKNPTEWGMVVNGDLAKPIQLMEIRGNRFWDDQGTAASMQAAIRFPNAQSVTAISTRIITDNSVVRGSAPVLSLESGGTTETWLVKDGPVQAWAGYGVPDIAAPNGSTYQQLDGKEDKTTFYVHVGGSWVGIV